MVELSASHLDTVFHALGDATRRTMLRDLSRGERTVSQLAQPFDISLAAASKHIKALENAGLIRREVRGASMSAALRRNPWRKRMNGWISTGSSGAIASMFLSRCSGRKIRENPLQMEEMTMADIAMPETYGRLVEPTT